MDKVDFVVDGDEFETDDDVCFGVDYDDFVISKLKLHCIYQNIVSEESMFLNI